MQLPAPGEYSFFLWGMRQSGKSTLLKETYPNAYTVDLLKSEEYQKYLNFPERLREELQSEDRLGAAQIIIDEVQRVPELLNSVHWLIENRGLSFALCCSSAIKLRRGGVNLLGGRALRHQLHGLTSVELSTEFDLTRMLNTGYLPRIYGSKRWQSSLRAYVLDYLASEVAIEASIRNLPAFSAFLSAAALSDTESVNYTNVAGDCGVSVTTAKSYYEILADSMAGTWLPAYRRRPKRRLTKLPKFYFNDVGVVNVLARRNALESGSVLFGHAFENWVFHELRAYKEYAAFDEDFSFWRLSGGTEVDFIVGDMLLAIEAKATPHLTNDRLKSLRSLFHDHPETKRRIVVSLVERSYVTNDNIEVMSVDRFTKSLWNGEILDSSK